MAGQIKVLLFDQITVINGNGVRIPFLKVAKAGERIELVICLCVTRSRKSVMVAVERIWIGLSKRFSEEISD